MAPPILRPATGGDAPSVAEIWRAGWHDAHDGFVPDALVAVRTDESFRARAVDRVGDTTVAIVDGAVAGFVMVAHDEVEQVYVAAAHRGRGAADALLTEAERQVRAAGHGTAWLAVVAGNGRARAFYERRGWTEGGLFEHHAPSDDGPIVVPSHRYEKHLA